MDSDATLTAGDINQKSTNVPADYVRALLDTVEKGVVVTDREGRLLMVNAVARKHLASYTKDEILPLNIFQELLFVDPREVSRRIDGGENEIELEGKTAVRPYRVRIRWIPESDWLAIQFAGHDEPALRPEDASQPTVQELLQEREITYRNLLAAYLRLQEVNRQKTVFLASAAHELKTPLAVIKGYYDLLLTNSLGRLSEKQRDILEESKESCERLVRLVSMFLNYSALESGKLVLQMRENDLRDCLAEMATRWSDAFQRKGVKLETHLDPSIPTFKFDYQKVQQAAANLLDNALETHAGRWHGHTARSSAFLGTPRLRSCSRRGASPISFASPEQRRSQRHGFRRWHSRRASSGNFRRFRARRSQHLWNGLGIGDRQAANSSASRKNLG